MDHKKRITYFAVTLTMYIIGFILYGCIAAFVGGGMNLPWTDSKPVVFLLFGLLGGHFLSSLISGILLFANFTAKKGIAFKVICCVFFAVTIAVIFYVGVFAAIPYGIYNIIKLVSGENDSDVNTKTDNTKPMNA
jgi:hypothetical protein